MIAVRFGRRSLHSANTAVWSSVTRGRHAVWDDLPADKNIDLPSRCLVLAYMNEVYLLAL